MVRAPVAEAELERVEPHGATEELVAEADPEHRGLPDKLADRPDYVVERRGVPGPVREEDEVGIGRKDLSGRHGAWKEGQPAIPLA